MNILISAKSYTPAASAALVMAAESRTPSTSRLSTSRFADDDTAVLLAGLAEGSIGKGLELARSPLLEQRAELIAQVDDPNGLRRVGELLDLAERLGRSAPELPMFFRLVRAWYRDVLLAGEGAGDEVLVHRDLIPRIRARAGELTAGEILARLDLLNETERAITRRAANARLSLETLLLGLAAPRGGPSERTGHTTAA